jgi:aryl-alcohol dehydrogenase-like predicted oxidoreductase
MEHGVNFIDTADVYARGGAERVLLRAGRDDWVVASKLGFPICPTSVAGASLKSCGCAAARWPQPVVCQHDYNLVNRSPYVEIQPACTTMA